MRSKCYLSLVPLLLTPLVSAEDCGLLNLATCIPQKIFEFFLSLFNAPLQLLLSFIQNLLTSQINLNPFASIWAIVIYVLSLFYGLLLLYSGFNFIISGYDTTKRAKAKQWFQNIFIMIVLIQGSYFLYSLIIDLSMYMTAGVINLIDPQFFLLTADNLVSAGLQFLLVPVYVIVLLITALFLTLRYIAIVAGIALAPIGIFLYFIPPLKGYGKLILNSLGICIFVTFFDAIVFLIGSLIAEVPVFTDFKIFVMIGAFLTANLLMIYLMFFSTIRSALKTELGGNLVTITTAIGAMFA